MCYYTQLLIAVQIRLCDVNIFDQNVCNDVQYFLSEHMSLFQFWRRSRNNQSKIALFPDSQAATTLRKWLDCQWRENESPNALCGQVFTPWKMLQQLHASCWISLQIFQLYNSGMKKQHNSRVAWIGFKVIHCIYIFWIFSEQAFAKTYFLSEASYSFLRNYFRRHS